MARPDLVALTPDGLAQLGNVGLVKRGQRDLAAGAGPTVVEGGDGTVEARFADGTTTRLAPGRPPQDAACTCPASGMCRHRVLLVLAYQRAAGATGEEPGASPPPGPGWDPAALDLDACEAGLSASGRAELARLLRARLTVGLDRGAVPAARLPVATVRFLVPGEIGYARCDCAAGGGCAHVALAIRAFRAAAGAGEAVLGAGAAAAAAAGAVPDLRAAVDAVLAGLLAEGVVAGRAAHAAALAGALDGARAAGATQLVLALDEMSDQIAAYEDRSARHDEGTALLVAAELFARTRAVEPGPALGFGEPMESAMGKTRLASLGARLVGRGAEVLARVLLADTDTGAVLALEKRFDSDPARPARAPVPESLSMAPGLVLAGIGRGQILTGVARRRADGLLALGHGGRGRTALMPRSGGQIFPPPLAAARVDAVLAELAARPVSLVRPRDRGADMRVFPVGAVLGQGYAPGEQVWRAAVELPDGGGCLHLERAYDAAAPGALDALSSALGGEAGPLREVAGVVRADRGALVCTPWSLSCDAFVVPDLEAARGGRDPATAGPVGRGGAPDRAFGMLAKAIHAGRRGRDRGAEAEEVDRLARQGFAAASRLLAAWSAAPGPDAGRFGRAAVWLATLREG